MAMKVGKNQIYLHDDLWTIEVYEFMDGATPMYSVWDATPSKSLAIKYAKLVTRNTSHEGFYARKFKEDNEKLAKRK